MRELKFSFTKRKIIPFDFVLDALAERSPYTKPMFGCTGVYVDEKIVFILRDRKKPVADDGVWICTSADFHAALKPLFPNMRSIKVFETPVTGWQVLPAEADDFEESVYKACELVLKNDPRIGREPSSKKRSSAKVKKPKSKKSTQRHK